MSFKQYKASCAARVARPQQETNSKNTDLPSTSTMESPSSATSQEELYMRLCKIFPFIGDTYRDLQSLIAGLNTSPKSSLLMQTINKYKNGCNEVYTKVLESYDMCYKFAQNIVRTTDMFKALCACLSDLEEYNYRLCEIMSIFIVCELRLSIDASQEEQLLIGHRIVYIMRKYLVREDENETLYNILRTLVYIPKLFNAREIMCAIFGEFIPIKPIPEVNVLPDKLYILYIIVFYRWMMMQKDDDDKLLIVNFAESFMKPSVSLCSNNVYGAYLPMYTTHSTATRTILNNLKFYRDIRNASIIDNALRKAGAIVNLCDDEDEDIILVDTSPTTDFVEIFASVRLEPITASMSNIKLERTTVVDTVDLTEEDENTNTVDSISVRHDKWLNEFKKLAEHYRESKLLLEKQLVSDGRKETVICLDSDSEVGAEEISAAVSKELLVAATVKQQINSEELFVDNYPITNTPLNYDSDLDPSHVADENDVTKISLRFLSDNLRTYQVQKRKMVEKENKRNSDGVGEQNKSEDVDKVYRRDSIHISSTPPDEPQEEDDGTDVQDENDDLLNDEEDVHGYSFLPTTSKSAEKQMLLKQLPQYYSSDSAKINTQKKQKKKVTFKTNHLGPSKSNYLGTTVSPKMPLKPAIQLTKYKVSDAPEYYHLRGFERFSCPNSTEDSVSTTSSTKKQDHLEAAALFFGQSSSGQFSPSLSSVSSRSLTSPATPTAKPKKFDLSKTKKRAVKLRRPTMSTKEDLLNISEVTNTNNDEKRVSIIRNREMLHDGYHSTCGPGMSSYEESSDDYYGAKSDYDVRTDERYKNDAKLRKLCAVVITPSKELSKYLRKRDEMFNEILQKQRRKLELRAFEKQKEKERKKKEEAKLNLSETTTLKPEAKNFTENCMSSESEYEMNFHVRTRKQRQQSVKDVEPLRSDLRSDQFEIIERQQNKQPLTNNDTNAQTCDISPTKTRELNLLADIAQHISAYKLDLPENFNPPRTTSPPSEPPPPALPLPSPTHQTPNGKEVPKGKVTITEQLIIQSLSNLSKKSTPHLEDNDQQQEASTSYAHEPQLNTAAIFKSSPCASLLHNQQNNTQLENCNNHLQNNNSVGKELIKGKTKTDETLEQILEESISVFKYVATNPYNPLTECTPIRQQTRVDSTIPILISNVESLNKFEPDDVVVKQSDDESRKPFPHDNKKRNCGNFALMQNAKTKDGIEEHNRRKASDNVLSSNILSSVELTANLLPNVSSISRNLKVSTVTAADLSDISLESEPSKHLPEIAEPSPVVTDMSDNSNQSDVSKTFHLHIPINQNTNADSGHSNEISLPVLSLVMPNISQQSSQPLESNFHQINCSLNTPAKLTVNMSRAEELVHNATGDLNTPIKFHIQPDLATGSNMSVKNTTESETDNNVTKFLDLILNKTVTDAESETRDEIIKELNALTADTSISSDIHESSCNNEIIATKSKLGEGKRNKSSDLSKAIDEDGTPDGKIFDNTTNHMKQQLNFCTENNESNQTLDYSSSSHIDKISYPNEIATQTEQNSSETLSANIAPNPPIENLKEDHTPLFSDIESTELRTTSTAIVSSPTPRMKSPALKKIIYSRCRVRLKRLNIDDHNSRTAKSESWIAVPITKPSELISSNNEITKCDTATEKTLPIRKPCLKPNNKHKNDELLQRVTENLSDVIEKSDAAPNIKKTKLEAEKLIPLDATQSPASTSTTTVKTEQVQTATQPSALINHPTIPSTKSKSKTTKTVTFQLSNLNDEPRGNTFSNHKQKSKSHTSGILLGSRSSRKLPENTLRAAETLQLFVNTINDSSRTPSSAEFNTKRSSIKNKCIAEDETPRPPPPSTLLETPPCKKTCTEKLRTQITTSKCKDQLVSSLATPPISSITSDITTTRIYTSSPLDQTLPEYDDNVDTVPESALILPSTTGSLRRKLKRPKKSLSRPEPPDDIITDEISNQQDCTADDEQMLEDIVTPRTPHIGAATVIRDDYMNIEATATVPVYLFNEESRDLGSPEIIQTTDNTGVVDSSSYLNNSSSTSTNNVVTAPPPGAASTTSNVEKSMLSPSEHEVSSTQETFYQTPTKTKQPDLCAEKSSTSEEKVIVSGFDLMATTILKQKPEENSSKHLNEYQTSCNIGLLQNNQVDTTNHSPEMCTLALTATTTTTTTLTNNRKMRKASTHDEILFNELQLHQLPTNKRKSNTFCVESTSDNSKSDATNVEDIKSKGSLAKADDKLKKLLKEVSKRDKTRKSNELNVELPCKTNNNGASVGAGGGCGGSSPSTTTTVIEEKVSKSKRKKAKLSKSKKSKSHSERSSKIVLKASKLTTHTPDNPLIITIPKSRLLKPPTIPLTPINEQQQSEFLDILNSRLFLEKDKARTTLSTTPPITTVLQKRNNQESPESSGNLPPGVVDLKPIKTVVDSDTQEVIRNTNSTTIPEKYSFSSELTTKKKEKLKDPKLNASSSNPITLFANSKNNNLIFVKDKYDLIKSKEKYHHYHHDQQSNKEKWKDKTSSQSKSTNSSNTRVHKSSSKDKIKVEKTKVKHKDAEKISDMLKSNISQNKNKSLTSSPSSIPILLSSLNNIKQSKSKSSRSNNTTLTSTLSSPSSLANSALHKSKMMNLSTTQL